MDDKFNLLKSSLVLATSLAFSLVLPSAQATLLQVDTGVAESGSPLSLTNSDTNNGSEDTKHEVTASSFQGFDVSAASWGNDSGQMYAGARSSGDDPGWYAESIFKSIQTVTNNSGTTQTYDYSLFIDNGHLKTYQKNSFSMYSIDVSLETEAGIISNVFDSSARLNTDILGNYSVDITGTELTDTNTADIEYSWNEYTQIFDDLFTLDDGQSITLTYLATAITQTQGNILTPAALEECNFIAPGDQNIVPSDSDGSSSEINCFPQTQALIGDPSNLNVTPISTFTPTPSGGTPPSPVPEPATLLLMLGGLSGLSLIRRRRKYSD